MFLPKDNKKSKHYSRQKRLVGYLKLALLLAVGVYFVYKFIAPMICR